MALHGLQNAGLWLARKLLSVWVRSTITPGNPRNLGIDAEKPLLYLIETRSLANLLVAEQACIHEQLPPPTAPLRLPGLILPRSVAAAVNWQPADSSDRTARYSTTLKQLIRCTLDDPGFDIQLVPVAVFFGRRPDRESSSLKLLFSDNLLAMGRLRKFFIVLLHGRNTWVQFNAPLMLREFVDQALARNAAEEALVRKLSRLFRVHFRHQRSTAIGPDLSLVSSTVDALLRSRAGQAAIAAEVERSGISPLRAHARARRYVYEIAANISYPFLLLMRRGLRRLWDRLYDGVEVHHLDGLQESARGRTLVYLPCHRSHIDYLLLTYLLHNHGLAIPHIAAGINLNLPGVGRLLRSGGGFFLRRSFRGKPLYGAIFHAYLAGLLTKGFSVEYFIEGGRSRTGFSLTPRPGMLDMTVRASLAERGRPLLFVPVYIGYEKLVEGRSYAAELGGSKKTKESLLGLLRGLRGLGREFGKVHVNFAEPIELEALFDAHCPHWRETSFQLADRPEWVRSLVDHLAREAVSRINSAADLNPINLLAILLLASPRLAMAEQELRIEIDRLRALLVTTNYSSRLTVTTMTAGAVIEHGIRLGFLRRHEHPLGAIIAVDADDPAPLRYFANNILHLVILPGVIAGIVNAEPQVSQLQLAQLAALVYPYLRNQLYLHWSANQAVAAVEETVSAMVAENLLCADGTTIRVCAGAHAMIERLAQTAAPVVERFFLVIAVLIRSGSGRLSEEEFELLCFQLAQRLSMLYAFKTPDFANQAVFGKLLRTLKSEGQVWLDDNDKIAFPSPLIGVLESIGLLLSESIRHDVLKLTEL